MEELREMNARLFSENEQLKRQINDKQLEIEHCHAVCGELRDMLTKEKLDSAAFAAEVDEAHEQIADLQEQKSLALAAMGLANGGQK